MSQSTIEPSMWGDLDSPLGHYKPEMLVLAPEEGEDDFVLSLVAQLLELGVAIELTDDWCLPTQPPRELSAYTTCLFPESAADRYDADLDAFHRAGGWLPYFKYYPTRGSAGVQGVHHYLHAYGRDLYFYHLANTALESGVQAGHRDFIATMCRRRTRSMLEAYRARFVARYADQTGPWRSWGDPQFTQFMVNILSSEATEDAQWRDVVGRCVQRLHETVPEFLDNPMRFQEVRLPGVVQNQAVLMGAVLMRYGLTHDMETYCDSGVRLTRLYLDRTRRVGDALVEAGHRRLWSESLAPLPAYYGAWRITGERRFLEAAQALVRLIAPRNQAASGLWHHWSDDQGHLGACWSRATLWAALWLTEACELLHEHEASEMQRLLPLLQRTYDGVARVQDAQSGLWHLVMDEPTTRVESSATAGLIHCHDRLRDLGGLNDAHDSTIERAFIGMKQFWYAGGTAANCRGTATGTPEYYRTRPLGHYTNSLYPATFAIRLDEGRGRHV